MTDAEKNLMIVAGAMKRILSSKDGVIFWEHLKKITYQTMPPPIASPDIFVAAGRSQVFYDLQKISQLNIDDLAKKTSVKEEDLDDYIRNSSD